MVFYTIFIKRCRMMRQLFHFVGFDMCLLVPHKILTLNGMKGKFLMLVSGRATLKWHSKYAIFFISLVLYEGLILASEQISGTFQWRVIKIFLIIMNFMSSRDLLKLFSCRIMRHLWKFGIKIFCCKIIGVKRL